jgi:hypothetical protein
VGEEAVDVARLPAEVVRFLDALAGTDLVVTRDGEPIATIRSTRPVAEPAGEPPDHPPDRAGGGHRDAAVADGEGGVVRRARPGLHRARPARRPGHGRRRAGAPDQPAADRRPAVAVPGARIVVAEIDDDELGISYRGPVRRLLDAGAEAYLAATTVPRLALQLDHAVTRSPPIAGAAAPRSARVRPSLREHGSGT